MTKEEKSPLDPFSDINLDDFDDAVTSVPTPKSKVVEDAKVIEIEEIKKVAAKSEFTSRVPLKEKSKYIARSFSLFRDDLSIIEKFKTDFENNASDSMQLPSGSDVVRAALHVFSNLPIEEKIEIVQQHRGRGRK